MGRLQYSIDRLAVRYSTQSYEQTGGDIHKVLKINYLHFLAWLLAYGSRATKSRKMKKRLKISTLIVGIIVAVLALSNSSSYAEKSDTNEVIQLKPTESEVLEIIEHVLAVEQSEPEPIVCLKIYNSDRKLVYESRDKDDERLIILLRRSDLIWRNDSSSYYLLGN